MLFTTFWQHLWVFPYETVHVSSLLIHVYKQKTFPLDNETINIQTCFSLALCAPAIWGFYILKIALILFIQIWSTGFVLTFPSHHILCESEFVLFHRTSKVLLINLLIKLLIGLTATWNDSPKSKDCESLMTFTVLDLYSPRSILLLLCCWNCGIVHALVKLWVNKGNSRL